jgi:hypothetical protein
MSELEELADDVAFSSRAAFDSPGRSMISRG